MSREWTQREYQKSWLTANLKEGQNKAVPEKPGKMGYIQPWVKETYDLANGTIEGNGIWKSEGVARRFKTALYIYTQGVTGGTEQTSEEVFLKSNYTDISQKITISKVQWLRRYWPEKFETLTDNTHLLITVPTLTLCMCVCVCVCIYIHIYRV